MILDDDPPEVLETAEPDAPSNEGGGEAELDTARSGMAGREPEGSRSSREESWLEQKRSLEAQARIYQEENERNRRELEALRAAQRVDPREEQARLEAMDPEQRVLYHFDKATAEQRNNALMAEVRTSAQIDSLKFEQALDKIQKDFGWSASQREKYQIEVDRMYNLQADRMIKAGRPDMIIPRVDFLKHKLGDELMTSGAKAIKLAGDRGKASITRQTTRMTPASSNATGKTTGKSKADESRERMLAAGVLEL